MVVAESDPNSFCRLIKNPRWPPKLRRAVGQFVIISVLKPKWFSGSEQLTYRAEQVLIYCSGSDPVQVAWTQTVEVDQQNPAGRTRLFVWQVPPGPSEPLNINITLRLIWTEVILSWRGPEEVLDQQLINRVQPRAWRSDSLPVFGSFFSQNFK